MPRALLRWRFKDRKTHFLTDRVVAPHQFLDLFLRHVQLFAGFKVDGVDDAVGVDVLSVYMGADQHLAAVEVLRQPPRGFVGLSGIDGFALRKALHHVIEHHAAVFVVEELGVQEIIVDALRLTVDAADERRALPCGFLLLHDVEHHAAHGGAGLCAPLVVHKMYDGHTAHRPSMTDRSAALTSDNSCAALSRPMTCTLPMLARTVRRLMLLPMPFELAEQFFLLVDDDDPLAETAGGDVVAHGHVGLRRQRPDLLTVGGRHARAEFDIFFSCFSPIVAKSGSGLLPGGG